MQREKNTLSQVGVMIAVAGLAILLAKILGAMLVKFAWPLILIGGILAVIGYALPGRRR
jgi:hypothetical protein